MSYSSYHNLPDLARKGGFMLCDGAEEQDVGIDWRFIASLDSSRIIKDCDFEKLDQCIPFLIRSSVGNLLNVRILDPAIAKIYILSQLCLQYLLFCTKFLDKSVYALRENIFNSQKKNVQLEEIIEKRDEEIEQLQKKLKRQEALNQPIFPCTKCTKNFVSAALLENHIQRKHPQIPESKDKDSNLINTIKLELEIKQLKERLYTTEKELMDASQKIECEQCKINAQRKFQSVGVQSNFEEKEKDDIEKDAIAELLNNQMKNFEELKQIEETRNRSEINELRCKLDDTIALLRNQKEVPSPAPRLIRIADKTVGTSIESLPEKSEKPEELWKSKCDEMEKFYEERMFATVSGLEKSYNDKMLKIEERMKEIEVEKNKVHQQLLLQDKKQKLQEEAKSKFPLSPKIVKKIVIEDLSSTESSSGVDDDDKATSTTVIKVSQFKPESSEPVQPPKLKSPVTTETFSAQKFFLRSKCSKQKPKVDKLDKAKNVFFKRLTNFGISQDQKHLTKSEFSRVQSKLVDTRDEVKKKHKSFFKARRQVLSNLDKIYKEKTREDSAHESTKTKQSTKIPKLQENFKKSSLVQAKVEDSKMPELKLSSPTKKAFHEDLEKTLAKRLPSSLINVQPTRDLETLPTSSKRKEKKVEFDLKDDYKIHGIKEIREEEDSDFDVSSFISDFEEEIR